MSASRDAVMDTSLRVGYGWFKGPVHGLVPVRPGLLPAKRRTHPVDGPELHLRWPSGDVSALIPLSRDHFIDRSYWADVAIERDASGHPALLSYDRFHGKAR